MDRRTAKEVSKLLATLIGEIMEDHADLALTYDGEGAQKGQARLCSAGEDIAHLARALEVVARRAER